jgi:hypothetical protein
MPQQPTENSMTDIAPRVRHLETEVGEIKETQRAIFGEMRATTAAIGQVQSSISGMEAGRPNSIVQLVSLGLQVLTTSVLLIGATVGTITYIASNANNADMAVLKERMAWAKERISQLEQGPQRFSPVMPAR